MPLVNCLSGFDIFCGPSVSSAGVSRLEGILRSAPDKATVLDYFTMQIDRDLNAMTFVDGDASLNEKVRGIARLRAHQAIDSLRDAHKV